MPTSSESPKRPLSPKTPSVVSTPKRRLSSGALAEHERKMTSSTVNLADVQRPIMHDQETSRMDDEMSLTSINEKDLLHLPKYERFIVRYPAPNVFAGSNEFVTKALSQMKKAKTQSEGERSEYAGRVAEHYSVLLSVSEMRISALMACDCLTTIQRHLVFLQSRGVLPREKLPWSSAAATGRNACRLGAMCTIGRASGSMWRSGNLILCPERRRLKLIQWLGR